MGRGKLILFTLTPTLSRQGRGEYFSDLKIEIRDLFGIWILEFRI